MDAAESVRMNAIAVRLHPGQDLKAELDALAITHQWEAACILTCVGSLRQVNLRYADQEEGTRLTGKFEIVSLNGTFSIHGSHFHISLSDDKGLTIGGHLLEGCLIYTTAELVIGVFPTLHFLREFAADSGYDELVIRTLKE